MALQAIYQPQGHTTTNRHSRLLRVFKSKQELDRPTSAHGTKRVKRLQNLYELPKFYCVYYNCKKRIKAFSQKSPTNMQMFKCTSSIQELNRYTDIKLQI